MLQALTSEDFGVSDSWFQPGQGQIFALAGNVRGQTLLLFHTTPSHCQGQGKGTLASQEKGFHSLGEENMADGWNGSVFV